MWYYCKIKISYLGCNIGNRYWLSETNDLFDENMIFIGFVYDSEVKKYFESLPERRKRLINDNI